MAVWEPPNPTSRAAASAAAVKSPATPIDAHVLQSETFAPMSARRLLFFGGTLLIIGGMLFGDVFAVFVLHQNGARVGETLIAASQAVAMHNPTAVKDIFAATGGLLEDRGTKVDTHVHMSDAGYLALLLALVQPWVALSQHQKKVLAKMFLLGGALLPVGIFLIHYVGMAYSPFPVIGWASILADSAGALLIIALAGYAWGVWKFLRSRRAGTNEPELLRDRSWECQALLAGGTLLILLGFLHGAWYAGMHLYQDEAQDKAILSNIMSDAAANNVAAAGESVNAYGGLQAEKAVQIATHSHFIEFGLLAILLSFMQPYVFLGGIWKRRWVKLLLAGGFLLPTFVWLELQIGLLAGAIADIAGLMVIVALIGMLVGVLRYTGMLDGAGVSA